MTEFVPLRVDHLSYTYPGDSTPALRDINVELARRELVALVGPNGAGKSTLLSLIANTIQPQQGRIELYGSTSTTTDHALAYVPQRDNINWNVPLTVRDVVMTGRYPFLKRLRRPSAGDHAVVQQSLELLKLGDLAEKRIQRLSGGQKQRVILARALAQEAHILLLDEPLNGLDLPTQEIIFNVLNNLAADGYSILVSIHDLSLLRSHFERVIFLDRTIIADGPVEQILTVETLEKAYGVELVVNSKAHLA